MQETENDSEQRRTMLHELMSLAKRLMIAIAIIWVALYLFGTFLAPQLGVRLIHLQITSTIVTVGVSVVVITTVRRLVKRAAPRIGLHTSAVISFFIIGTVSLIAALAIMHEWQLDLQSVLIGGGVAAIIIGIALSTIIGNILSGGLVLTTFPAKIGDSVFIVNDNIRGTIEEVNFMYTKVVSDAGSEYVVPNSAIVQGNVRLIREPSAVPEGLPFARNDNIELVAPGEKYSGKVTSITSRFTYLSSEGGSETFISNAQILSGKYTIIKRKQPGSG